LCGERLGAERPALARSSGCDALMPARSRGLLDRMVDAPRPDYEVWRRRVRYEEAPILVILVGLRDPSWFDHQHSVVGKAHLEGSVISGLDAIACDRRNQQARQVFVG
jgi:hypothetical protein